MKILLPQRLLQGLCFLTLVLAIWRDWCGLVVCRLVSRKVVPGSGPFLELGRAHRIVAPNGPDFKLGHDTL